jgi:hypothetical protein
MLRDLAGEAAPETSGVTDQEVEMTLNNKKN